MLNIIIYTLIGIFVCLLFYCWYKIIKKKYFKDPLSKHYESFDRRG